MWTKYLGTIMFLNISISNTMVIFIVFKKKNGNAYGSHSESYQRTMMFWHKQLGFIPVNVDSCISKHLHSVYRASVYCVTAGEPVAQEGVWAAAGAGVWSEHTHSGDSVRAGGEKWDEMQRDWAAHRGPQAENRRVQQRWWDSETVTLGKVVWLMLNDYVRVQFFVVE